MDAIRNWLYIGKYRDTLDGDLASNNIGAVLQLAEAIKYASIESLYLPVEDGISLTDHHLQQGVDFVRFHKQQVRLVLVACGAGMSRSAAFAVAALKEEEELSLLDALRTVKSCHPDTMIHPALWKSLCAYYREEIPFLSALREMTSG